MGQGRRSAHGKKISLPGLVRRRAAEGELWLADDTAADAFRASTDMPQRVVADEARSAYRVNARSGLRLRSGPGLEHGILQLLPHGTTLFVEREINGWAAVDLEGDGAIDGYLSLAFLVPGGA